MFTIMFFSDHQNILCLVNYLPQCFEACGILQFLSTDYETSILSCDDTLAGR